MKTVLVFKTSITSSDKICSITPLLNSLMDKGEKWNFDLEDCDNILRVEAVLLLASDIIQNMKNAGFFCAELED